MSPFWRAAYFMRDRIKPVRPGLHETIYAVCSELAAHYENMNYDPASIG